MKLTVRQLRHVLTNEGRIKASPTYMKKEQVRSSLEDLIKSRVSDGTITNQEQLDEFLNSIELARTALKMVPFQVWEKLGS